MQGQMASFVASNGTFVQVGNSSLLVPVAPAQASSDADVTEEGDGGSGQDQPALNPPRNTALD
jgi:hypothetical protein